MKRLLLILLLIPCFLQAQTWSGSLGNSLNKATVSSEDFYRFNLGALGFWYPQAGTWLTTASIVTRNTLPTAVRKEGLAVWVNSVDSLYILKDGITNSNWYAYSSGDPQEVITAGTISSLPTVGFNPGSNLTPGEFITSVYYQSQVPLATLTGGIDQELHSAGTYSGSVSWGATRQTATQPLASIVVAGITQSFSQPSAGGTVNGTQAISMAYNTNTTYTNTVTTTDSKIGSATTSFTWLPKRYWGRSTGAPDNAAILSSTGGSNELSGSKAKSGFTITASGSNNVFYAYPLSLGVLTSITIGGFESFSAFTRTTVSVTNSSGYVQDFYVYTSNDTYSATTPSIIVQ